MPVTVLTLPNCQPCRVTKRMLSAQGVEFVERDMSTDEQAADWAKQLGYQQAPIVIAGDSHWSGLQPDRVKALPLN